MTCALGSSASADPAMTIFDRRTPLPTMTSPASTTARSMNSGHDAGNPIGVMAPYSMPDADTATSIEANEILRTSSSRRTVPLTSTRVVARTTQAASVMTSARRPDTTTQFAAAATDTPYRSQKAAVSETDGSISATVADRAASGGSSCSPLAAAG